MDKVKETILVLLIGYIFISVFIIFYDLLIWQLFSKVLSYAVLVALILLKGIIISMRASLPAKEFGDQDKIRLQSILLGSLIIFLIVVFISYMYQGRHLAAIFSLISLLVTVLKIKLSNSVH